jgi:hypothetical protein
MLPGAFQGFIANVVTAAGSTFEHVDTLSGLVSDIQTLSAGAVSINVDVAGEAAQVCLLGPSGATTFSDHQKGIKAAPSVFTRRWEPWSALSLRSGRLFPAAGIAANLNSMKGQVFDLDSKLSDVEGEWVPKLEPYDLW